MKELKSESPIISDGNKGLLGSSHRSILTNKLKLRQLLSNNMSSRDDLEPIEENLPQKK